jgi:hypothetical protein
MLLQGATNSVAQFCRIVLRILAEYYLTICLPFVDDIGVKGPTSRFEDEEEALSIRKFVLIYLQYLSMVLADIERAGCTISLKSQFYMNRINAVGFVCNEEGRKLSSSKVIKILD